MDAQTQTGGSKQCRGCLSSVNLTSIFDNHCNELYIDFIHMTVSYEDFYPQFICTNCVTALNCWQRFKKCCIDSMEKYMKEGDTSKSRCRTCLLDEPKLLFSFLEKDHHRMFTEMTGLSITTVDLYSDKICLSCLSVLFSWQNFKKKCIDSINKYYRGSLLSDNPSALKIGASNTEDSIENDDNYTDEEFLHLPKKHLVLRNNQLVLSSKYLEFTKVLGKSSKKKCIEKAAKSAFIIKETATSTSTSASKTQILSVERIKEPIDQKPPLFQHDSAFYLESDDEDMGMLDTDHHNYSDNEPVLETKIKLENPVISAVLNKETGASSSKKNQYSYHQDNQLDVKKYPESFSKYLDNFQDNLWSAPKIPNSAEKTQNPPKAPQKIDKTIVSNIENEIKKTHPELVKQLPKILKMKPPEKVEEKPFGCDLCEKTFRTKNIIRSHMLVHMQKSKSRYKMCEICGKYFTPKAIYRHRLTHKEKNVKCNYEGCNFVTTTIYYLEGHLLTHIRKEVNMRVFCDICNKDFVNQATLRRHRETHSTAKIFKCTSIDCEFITNSQRNLRKHQIRRHSTDRKFACPLCDQRFAQQSLLKSHFQLHSNIRNFICNYCGKGFKKNWEMKVHKSKIHQEAFVYEKDVKQQFPSQ